MLPLFDCGWQFPLRQWPLQWPQWQWWPMLGETLGAVFTLRRDDAINYYRT